MINHVEKEITKELAYRNCEFKPELFQENGNLYLELLIDENGNFIRGRAELKALLSTVDFDSRVDILDKLSNSCINQNLWRAIVEIQEELVNI